MLPTRPRVTKSFCGCVVSPSVAYHGNPLRRKTTVFESGETAGDDPSPMLRSPVPSTLTYSTRRCVPRGSSAGLGCSPLALVPSPRTKTIPFPFGSQTGVSISRPTSADIGRHGAARIRGRLRDPHIPHALGVEYPRYRAVRCSDHICGKRCTERASNREFFRKLCGGPPRAARRERRARDDGANGASRTNRCHVKCLQ